MNELLFHRVSFWIVFCLSILATTSGRSNCRADEPKDDLRNLQSEAIEALRAGDAQTAYDLALKLTQSADLDGNSNQSIYLLTAAAIMDAVGMTEERGRVMGVRASLLQVLPKEVDAKLIAEVLNDVQSFSQTIPQFYNNMQFELLMYYQQVLTATIDPSLSEAERSIQLEQLLGEHEQQLIEAKVPPAIAKILSVRNLLAALEAHRTIDAESWLKRLQPLLESAEVAPKWKALVWNKATELSISKRRFAEALENGRQFAFAAVQSGDFDAQVTCVDQLAVVYLYMGDYAASRFLLSQTEAAQRGNPNVEQANLWRVNMSKALEGDREFLLARQLLLEARDLSREVASFDSVMIRNNLAINYYLTGDLHEARQILQECQSLLPRINASDLQLAESHITAGWFNLAEKKLELARGEFKKAQELLLTCPDAGRNHPRFSEALACEARVAAAMSDNTRAVELIEESEALAFDGVLRELAATGATRDRLAILQAARVHPESVSWPGVFDTYLELAESIGIPLAKQFDIILKWKGVLSRLEATQRKNEASGEILALNQQLRELYFRPVSRLKRRQHLQEMELVENQIRVLERNLANSMVAQQNVADRPSTLSLKKQIGEGSAFVDILQVRKFRPPQAEGNVGAAGEYLAFIALPNSEFHRATLGDMDEIDAAIDMWRKQILEQKTEAGQTSQRVADYLQRPLLKHLHAVDTLMIREDGMCNLVPWAALPGTDGKQFWVENLAVCTVCDIASTAALRDETATKAPSILIVGGVEYGPLSNAWQPLPGTLQEANLVADLFRSKRGDSGAVELLSGNSATKSAVIRDLQSVSDAHLATHGFYLRQDTNNAFGLTTATTMLNSGLILSAPTDDESASQQLTAAEIRECKLDNLRLVVLSACETGMGKIKAGQGVDGLASSFHAAGVDCVISSRWKVPDKETSELMSSFYNALWLENVAPAQALRQAQLHMLKAPESSDQTRQTVAWAAFTTSYATPTAPADSH